METCRLGRTMPLQRDFAGTERRQIDRALSRLIVLVDIGLTKTRGTPFI